MAKNKSVSIKFSQGSYRLLKNYPFRPAGVFAELIDNSIKSYDNNKASLKKKPGYKLNIIIGFKGKDIVVFDNAGGISDENMNKAFEPGAIVKGKRGLNEFGIGMKNAAVWISNNYSVITKAINEEYTKKVDFDYNEVITKGIEELNIKYIQNYNKEKSFTEITLRDLRDSVEKFRFSEIGKELSSIYRQFLSSGEISISFFKEELSYKNPKELCAEYYPDLIKHKKGSAKKLPIIKWKFPIKANYMGKNVHGYVGILDRIAKFQNGIVYFKNGRVIEGAGDLKLFPQALCGTNGSHQQKRIFGELHFDEIPSDLSKSKLLDTEDIEKMIELIAVQLKNFKPPGSEKTYDLLKQARDMRVGDVEDENKVIKRLKSLQKKASKTENKKETEEKYAKVIKESKSKVVKTKTNATVKIEPNKAIERIIPIGDDKKYLLKYTVINEINNEDLYTVSIRDVKAMGERKMLDEGITKIIEGKINIGSPFVRKHEGINKGKSGEGFYELLIYMMISEAIVSNHAKIHAHYFRDTFNEILL